jgi:hypothetical protein
VDSASASAVVVALASSRRRNPRHPLDSDSVEAMLDLASNSHQRLHRHFLGLGSSNNNSHSQRDNLALDRRLLCSSSSSLAVATQQHPPPLYQQQHHFLNRQCPRAGGILPVRFLVSLVSGEGVDLVLVAQVVVLLVVDQ